MKTSVVSFAAALVLANTAGALAQSVAVQVGVFVMPAPSSCGGHSWCALSARSAMPRHGLKMSTAGQSIIFGVSQNVTVTVTCVDQGDHSAATIVAASTSSPTAEQARNAVRSDMVAGKCL